MVLFEQLEQFLMQLLKKHKVDSDIQYWDLGVENWKGMLAASCDIILRNLNTRLKKWIPWRSLLVIDPTLPSKQVSESSHVS